MCLASVPTEHEPRFTAAAHGTKLGLFALSTDKDGPVSYADFDNFRWAPP